MNKAVARRTKPSPPPVDVSDRSSERRAKIAHALEDCIRENGYAATSLTDIAIGARMSPSHIRYYFDGKEDILEFYLSQTCEEIMREISRIPRDSPEQWLRNFSAYFITNPTMTRASIAVLVEIFAAAVHNPKLAQIKMRYDEFIRGIFLEFFRWSGCADGIAPAEAAYTAWSIEIGMKFNAVFQTDFSREKARKVFLTEMRRMAGMTSPARNKS